MTYQEAFHKLEIYNQVHVLNYYNELNEIEKMELLAQIDATDFNILQNHLKSVDIQEKGKIEPLDAMSLDEINAYKDQFTQVGLEAIQAGKVGAVLLAGGMGTRLGSDEPKGMYNIGLTKDVFIFECIIHNILDIVNMSQAWIHLFIMTSEMNYDATTDFLKEYNYFGYNPKFIHFFIQEMAPTCDYSGKVFMESKSRISTSPNGNGGWFISMARTGILDVIQEENIEWLNVFAVDNVLQRIADPCFLGATISKNCAVGAKVVKKATPDERVGIMCKEDGKPSIIEYYEMTDELRNAVDKQGEPAYNYGVILNYLFRVMDLVRIMEINLPLHVVEKKISYINESGENVNPEAPNGYKFESLVLDMIHLMESCLPYEVIRNHEFAPIKNMTGVDSVDSARKLLQENGIQL